MKCCLRLQWTGSSLFVVQEGGQAEKWEVMTHEVPLLKQEERYILFLIPDHRATFYDPGVPRYDAVGAWSGFVKVTDNKVRFLSNADQPFTIWTIRL